SSVLRARDLKVLNALAQGLFHKQIVSVMKVAEKQVQIHLRNLRHKLIVHARTPATILFLQRRASH
ncbi:LuxR C-terminal-related transcriptional regulator, partial [Escherichia coli]|uniref:LuxR C-terminal-related transcriptional regulator n=1 Tax=Escherichia coli TaxID=562 RepID=UPI0012B710A9